MTSTWTPGAAIASGIKGTLTLKYEKTAWTGADNVRIWHQLMVGSDFNATYKITECKASSSFTKCPSGAGFPLNTGQDIGNGRAGEYYNTFWGAAKFAASGTVTIKIDLTITLRDQDTCTGESVVPVNMWARGGSSFELPSGVQASARNQLSISRASSPSCAVKTTNELTSPLDPTTGTPGNVLSGDTMKFTATWENTSSQPVTMPVYYTYQLGGEGNETDASWVCTSGTCPFGSGSTQLFSDGTSPPQTVFGSDPNNQGTWFQLAAGQKFSYEITLKTTLNDCTQEGYYQVQTFANRASATGDPGSFSTASASLPIQLGCADWTVEESFAGDSVPDAGWRALNSACLTKATQPATPPALGECSTTTGSPSMGFSPGNTGLPAGYLQLTSDTTSQVGAVVYNRKVPAKKGLVAEFTQYQFGADSSGADGIGFFLADGSYSLETVGPAGGSLGYASSATANGLPHGYLGIGFDVFGNFASTSNNVAPNCSGGIKNGEIKNSVTLRGPGTDRGGYCAVGPTQSLANLAIAYGVSSYTLRYQRSGTDNGALQTALLGSERHTRLVIYPQASGAKGPRVTVQMDFGQGYVTMLDRVMTTSIPDTIRFGFLGSTGASKDAHLLSTVRIGTVMTTPSLELFKSVVQGNTPGRYSFGDVVDYKFLVTNNGQKPLYNIEVTDPSVPDIDCPKAFLDLGDQMECTGQYTVTADDRDNLYFLNEAAATATTTEAAEEGEVVELPPSSVEIAVNPSAENASERIAPGETATFQILDDGYTTGLVTPDDPSKVGLELLNPNGNPSGNEVTVSGQGTWRLTSAPDYQVTFIPEANFRGDATPIKYRVTSNYEANGVAGQAEGTLSVTVSDLPERVCSDAEHRASSRWWAFGDKVELDFGTAGTEKPTAGSLNNVNSGNVGTFTVSDMWGNLQFVVDPGQGRLITKSGDLMVRGGEGTGSDQEIEIPIGVGASPVTVFPDGQGSGRYVVVTSSATDKQPGQLTYRIIDMALNEGEGGLSGSASITLGGTKAGPAVTSVPNSNGTGYWVVNPERGTVNVMAYLLKGTTLEKTVQGKTGTLSSSGLGSGVVGYEDIRFSPDLSLLATLSSKSDASINANRTQVRLLSFNATSGQVGLYSYENWGASDRLGYSLDFSPNSRRLYFSSVATSGSSYAVEVASTGTAASPTLPSNVTDVTTGSSTGGAVRLGPDGRLYWADWIDDGSTALRYLPNPDGTGNTWSSLTLAEETDSNWALSNTLTDCAIPPRKLYVQMLDSDGQPLEGANFALYQGVGNGQFSPTPVDPGFGPTGVSGETVISGLAAGTYRFEMTQAPKGYTLLAQSMRLTVRDDGTVVFPNRPPTPQAAFSSDDQGKFTITITATSAGRLPFAGGHGKWLVAAGTTLFIAVVAGTLWRRRQLRVSGGRYAPRH